MNSLSPGSDWIPKSAAILALTVLTIWFGSLGREPLKGGPLPIVRLELASPDLANTGALMWSVEDFQWVTEVELRDMYDRELLQGFTH